MVKTQQESTGKLAVIDSFFGYLSRTPPYLLFVHLIWIMLASAVLSASYIVAFHFTSVLNIYQEAHSVRNFSANLQVSARKDREISAALTSLLESTGSNRAYVFRYHNGLAAVNGVPFFFQTMTHEVISPGTPRVMQFEQRIPASMNMAVNNKFSQNMCAVVEHADDDRDSQNYWYFQSRGARSLIRCPIFMPNGDLFGFIGVDYTTDVNGPPLATAATRIREVAGSMAGIFSAR
jgi:hypothetical protein